MPKISKLILTVATLLAINCCDSKKETKDFPFLDTSLSIEERINDLVGRMTLEEKIGQMMNQSPAIERLGVPQYNWWSEALHGVARAGLATVFPQAIGLGATFDENMMFTVANTISDEGRAKHHEFVRKNKRFIYQGLTFWSPNINIFRDPRWGRGQETYGEDPYLTGRLAVQFIKGLQGDDPKYFKTIATAKHFAVHSGPESERHFFDAQVSEKDFRETYLPQFEMAIKEGKAYSVMCAYNRLNGEACCGSNHLLNGILRNEWGFDGFVVSDCDAINDISEHHKVVSSPEEGVALAIKSGTDLECGKFFEHVKAAIDKKLITEKDLDIAVKRLFTARFRLGMFDPPDMVKYAQIPYSVVDNADHKKTALEASRESIVLLKNENSLLPLKKDIGTVAVIGPNSNQWLMLLGNYNGVPSNPITPLKGIINKLPNSNVLYAQGCELAKGMPMFDVIPADVLFTDNNQKGLKADFYNNNEFKGDVLYSAVDSKVDINWYDKAPRKDMDDDNFSVRWSGELRPTISGVYQLGFISTCKTRLYLDDTLVAKTVYHFRDEYGDPRLRKSDTIKLEAGKRYKIRLEAAESYADAQVQLVWGAPQPDLKKQAIETAMKADVVIMCMGLTARMEGEEMDIAIDGFKGGDRTKLDLPDIQQQLIKEIQALGKPVVLVLLNGSALAINWESQHLPAIVEAWYPGQAAGEAIADVLFGDYNPAGRLPVTFYSSVNDLPPFSQYKITDQTYRYFKGTPLYPFGYGLSYTTFRYDNLEQDTPKLGEAFRISVDVTNTGKVAGDEVVQLYVTDKQSKAQVRALKAFKRINLKPRETRTIQFTIPKKDMMVTNEKNVRVLPSVLYRVSVGGGQPGVKNKTSGNVLEKDISLDDL